MVLNVIVKFLTPSGMSTSKWCKPGAGVSQPREMILSLFHTMYSIWLFDFDVPYRIEAWLFSMMYESCGIQRGVSSGGNLSEGRYRLMFSIVTGVAFSASAILNVKE